MRRVVLKHLSDAERQKIDDKWEEKYGSISDDCDPDGPPAEYSSVGVEITYGGPLPPWDEEVTLTVTRRELEVIGQGLELMQTAVDAVRLWDLEDDEIGAKRMEHFTPEELRSLGRRLERTMPDLPH